MSLLNNHNNILNILAKICDSKRIPKNTIKEKKIVWSFWAQLKMVPWQMQQQK
jgi:midasin (ATPase involved in ribosome maturation)